MGPRRLLSWNARCFELFSVRGRATTLCESCCVAMLTHVCCIAGRELEAKQCSAARAVNIVAQMVEYIRGSRVDDYAPLFALSKRLSEMDLKASCRPEEGEGILQFHLCPPPKRGKGILCHQQISAHQAFHQTFCWDTVASILQGLQGMLKLLGFYAAQNVLLASESHSIFTGLCICREHTVCSITALRCVAPNSSSDRGAREGCGRQWGLGSHQGDGPIMGPTATAGPCHRGEDVIEPHPAPQ